jgi:hypothetical protein
MALPVDVREQIAQRDARLRLVPANEPPPAAVREEVRLWQEHVHEAAEAIRWADSTIGQLEGVSEAAAGERDRVLALVREMRARAFDLMRQLNPDQAWFWTEEWQAKEREADADEAAGRSTVHASTDDFLAAMDARRAPHADA